MKQNFLIHNIERQIKRTFLLAEISIVLFLIVISIVYYENSGTSTLWKKKFRLSAYWQQIMIRVSTL